MAAKGFGAREIAELIRVALNSAQVPGGDQEVVVMLADKSNLLAEVWWDPARAEWMWDPTFSLEKLMRRAGA